MRAPSILIALAPLALASLAGCKVDDRVLVPTAPGSADSGIVGIPIAPFDGSNTAGIFAAWWSAGDYYDAAGTPGAGTCPRAGFPQAECSAITSPKPGTPFLNVVAGLMCTKGMVAVAPGGDAGYPDSSDVWGNTIGFDLNHAPGDGGLEAGDGGPDAGAGASVYNAIAHHITGFAFDIVPFTNTPNSVQPIPPIRVEFPTEATEANPAYWGGATMDLSPVWQGTLSRSYQIRWADVGGPLYFHDAPSFDPSTLRSIQFHVPSVGGPYPQSYSFCIQNTVMLTGP